MADAKPIYQAFLDETSELMWNQDYATYATRMQYPYRMRTAAKDTFNEVPEDSVACSRAFRENLTAMGAQAFHRICIQAEFETSNRIHGVHTTYILRGATELLPPFRTHLTLHFVDGIWLGGDVVAEIRNADISINAAPVSNVTSIKRAM
ncbi:hypothetical protein [Jannaschia sp. 2305UL9-9]|uniref:hypothetical protein n=1 Tax=Jannaschia sp. 2305UL9-9 TaxID=3121638 RepID=UPI003526DB26